MCEKLWSCDECNIGMLQACNAATTKIPTQQASCDTDCDETGVKGTQMSCDSDCDYGGCDHFSGCDEGNVKVAAIGQRWQRGGHVPRNDDLEVLAAALCF